MPILTPKNQAPIFLKESSAAETHLQQLKDLKPHTTGKPQQQIVQEIKRLEAGIAGEKQIIFELKNSHMPMVVLHDLYFEKNGCTAQIDYLVITRGRVFILECKNLIGDIDIDSSGNFTRAFNYGEVFKREGIYSPITQNQRHMELIKLIRLEAKTNFITKAMFNKYFTQRYRSIIVMANPKTVLNARYATKEIKDQVIRADQLIAYMKKSNAEKDVELSTDKEMMNLAQFFLAQHQENPKDYLEKYRQDPEEAAIDKPVNEKIITGESSSQPLPPSPTQPELRQPSLSQPELLQPSSVQPEQEPPQPSPTQSEPPQFCPRCGAAMIKRIAARGANVGKEFYGCSQYPKCRQIINLT